MWNGVEAFSFWNERVHSRVYSTLCREAHMQVFSCDVCRLLRSGLFCSCSSLDALVSFWACANDMQHSVRPLGGRVASSLPSPRWWRQGSKTRWQWTIVLAVHLKPPTLGISALVKLAHHLVSRQYAILTDGCGSKQPRGYTWASNAFVEGRIPSQKCLSGFQPRTAESICMRMSLMLQLRAGLTG